MDNTITPSTGTTARPQTTETEASTSTASETGSSTAITSDFETFLVMLTAQIENQDPLNPIDSTDYAVQLATFSGVEQQVLTNELLGEMSSAQSGMGALSDLAGWVGMEARVAGKVTLAGDGVDLSLQAPADLSDGAIEIRDSEGELVTKLDIAGGETAGFWDGRNSYGARVADGTYDIAWTGRDSSGTRVSGEVSSYIRVTEARLGTTGPEIRLADNRIIIPDDITALRSPESAAQP